MADRQVTKSRKAADGDITALCGSWGSREKQNVIDDIENRINTYFVDQAGYRSDVHVVNGPTGKYLRTDADSSSANNLDNLPDC